MNETATCANSDKKLANIRSLDVLAGWQPIETAPENMDVLIWDRFDVCIARKGLRGWRAMGCDGPAISSQDDFGTSYQEPGPPTHWMPLPAPPVQP